MSALNAEISTEIAIVSANCLYSRPVIPPMNADRDEHRGQDQRDRDDRARTSSIALERGLARRHALLDVVLDRLDDDDRVVDDEADGEHEAEERQRVDREAEQREHGERADERHRHGDQRDQRRAPVLQEEEHDEDDEHDGLEERVHDLADALGDRQRRVERDR